MPLPIGSASASSVYIDPPRWEDLRIPLTTTRAAANAPTFTQFRDDGAGSAGVFSSSFSAVAIEQLFFIAQLPHYYKQGTNIRPHIHWSPSDAAAGNVVWGLEYSVQNPANAPFGLTTAIGVIQAAAGVAFQHQRASFPEINGSGFRISALIIGRIFRNTVGNTYGSAAFAHDLDFHFQIDNIGSNNEISKTDSGGV